MTLIKLSGFEYDDYTTYFQNVAGSIVTSNQRTGARAFSLGNSLQIPLGTDEDDGIIMGIGFRALQGGIMDIYFQGDGGTVPQTTARLHTTDQRLHLYRGNAATQLDESDPFIQILTWSYLELKLKCADAGGSFEARLNGKPVAIAADATGDTRAGGTDALIDQVQVSLVSGGWYIDDLYVCNEQGATHNDYLGDKRVYASNPNANGNHSGLTGSDGNSVNNFQQVDDGVTANDADYNGAAANDLIDTYGHEDLPASVSVVDGILVHTRAYKSDSGVKSGRRVFRSGSTDDFGPDLSLGITPANYWEVMQEDPVAAGAWTPANFNAGEFGYQTRA